MLRSRNGRACLASWKLAVLLKWEPLGWLLSGSAPLPPACLKADLRITVWLGLTAQLAAQTGRSSLEGGLAAACCSTNGILSGNLLAAASSGPSRSKGGPVAASMAVSVRGL